MYSNNKQHTSSSDSDNLVDINTSNLNANLIQKANPEFTTKNWIYQNPDTGQHLEKNETSIKDRFLVKNFYGSNYFTFDYSFLNNFTKTESSLQVKSFYQKFYIRNINKLNNKRLSCFDFSVNILSDASKHFSHDEFAVVTLTFTNLNKDDKNYLHFHLDSNLASDSEEKLSLLNKNIINISKNVVSFKEKEDVKVTKLNLVYQFSLEDRNLILNLTDDMEVLLGLTFFSTFNNTSFNETAANDIAKQEPTAKKRYESLHFFGLNELKLKFNFEEIFTAVNSNTTDSNVYNSRTAGSTETSFLHDIRFVFGISFGLFVLLATFFGILFCYLKRERKNANNLEKNDVGLDSSNGSSNIFNVVIPDIEESENKKLSSSEDLNSTERIQPIYNLIKFDKIQEEQITKNEWLSPEDRRSNNVTNSSSDISYNNKELKVNNTSSKKFKEYICKKNYKTKKADEINLNLGDILIIDQG
ncbi:hypothetical protein HK099_008496 [Clydaea vesicula]|uniref:SH3 domain-containing protein n=1 Tax=Clydaea vesicula TaxID=447962 RepID=A0AAD5U925_9FUNG|nr:hypothetical protein HK099_008496 [Clydaea vesicula]